MGVEIIDVEGDKLFRRELQVSQPIPILSPLGQEISPLSSMLDLSRIELRRLVVTLQEQVSELQRVVEQLKEDKLRMVGEMEMMRVNFSMG